MMKFTGTRFFLLFFTIRPAVAPSAAPDTGEIGRPGRGGFPGAEGENGKRKPATHLRRSLTEVEFH